MTDLLQKKLPVVGAALAAVIVVLVPFHAFLTVWTAGGVGHYRLLRLWPEFLLVILVFLSLILLFLDKKLWQRLEIKWLFWAIIAYAVLTVGLGFLAVFKSQVNYLAFGDGVILNLRFFTFFLACLILGAHKDWLRLHYKKLLLVPAAIVVIFGLLQFFVLPAGFLSHFGYGPHTIRPFETVDHNTNFPRLQSTLRGPNSLGAYLVIIVSALAVFLLRKRKIDKKWLLEIIGLVATIFVLFFSYSRSAYLGAALSLALLAGLTFASPKARKWLAGGVIVLVLIAGGIFFSFRHNHSFEDTFFHTSHDSTSHMSSNESHLAKFRRAGNEVLRQPFGRGTGTAGPASVHNTGHGARIAENYYLQIAQETGWLGLILFVLINVMVAVRLWKRRYEHLARLLFASLLGISLVNMFSHAWTDPTLSLIWWGLAGAALAPVIAGKEQTSTNTSFPRRRESKLKKETHNGLDSRLRGNDVGKNVS
jgi:hypothetical protein